MNLTNRTLTKTLALGLFESTQETLNAICSTNNNYQANVTIHNNLQWRCQNGECKLISTHHDWLFDIHTPKMKQLCFKNPRC